MADIFFSVVDFNHIIHIATRDAYKATVCKKTWDVLQTMCDSFKEKKLRVTFFNSTPQGGGGKCEPPLDRQKKINEVRFFSRINASCVAPISPFEWC